MRGDEELELGLEEAGKLLEWTLSNVFESKRHKRHTHARIAKKAAEELKIPVNDEMIAKAIRLVRREKNFNLARFPFSDPKQKA